MASPSTVTIKDLTGKFQLNKTISDDTDALLALQGLSWFTRKAISLATVALTVKEYQDKKTVYHVDITSVASGLTSTQEDRTLNWTDAPHSDRIFGKVVGRSRLLKLESFEMQGDGGEEDRKFLRAEYLKDLKTVTKFMEEDGQVIQSWAVSQGGGWTAEQVWGFEDVGGKRYYSRRIVVRKKTEVQRVRLLYDYKGEIAKERDESEDLAYGE